PETANDSSSPILPFSHSPIQSSSSLSPIQLSPNSRLGFYHLIDLTYTWLLRWAMRLRWVVALGALAVMWTAVPLYKQVKQEWIPSDVDEAEFQATITAPEGTSPESMSKAM